MLAIYLLVPLMPPRLRGDQRPVPQGYHIVDTLATLRTDRGRQGPGGSTPGATMPSVHLAWAPQELLANAGVRLLRVGRRRRLRVAGLLDPSVMLLTIRVSGTHLLRDATGSRSSRGAAGIHQQVAALPP